MITALIIPIPLKFLPTNDFLLRPINLLPAFSSGVILLQEYAVALLMKKL